MSDIKINFLLLWHIRIIVYKAKRKHKCSQGLYQGWSWVFRLTHYDRTTNTLVL